MAKKNEINKTVIYSCEVGNGSGIYRGVFNQISQFEYSLDVFKIDAGEKEIETTIKEQILVDTVYIRPKLEGLKPEEATRRAKAIQAYLKKENLTPDEALIIDKKSKKSVIETALKFECEKIVKEERILKDIPKIKLEHSVELVEVGSIPFYTKIPNKDVRKSILNYINSL